MELNHSLMDEISPSPSTNRDLPREYEAAIKNSGALGVSKKSSFTPGFNNNIFDYRTTVRETVDTGRTRSTRNARVPSLNLNGIEDNQS